MIIWGFRGRVRPLATIRTRCPRCGQEAAQRLVRSQRWFTLFFIPLFPIRTRYIATCTYCGSAQVVSSEVAKALAAGPTSAPEAVPVQGASPAGFAAAPEATASPSLAAVAPPPIDSPTASPPSAKWPPV